MGFFWDLFQQMQIHKRKTETSSLEDRVFMLEKELLFTQDILAQTLKKLEVMTGEDFNGDGRVG